MNELDPELDPLLDKILDGSAIDWGTESDQRPQLRDALGALELIDQVGRSHRRVLLSATLSPLDSPAAPARPRADDEWTWGHLRILERIGGGSFGEVFRAYDSKLQIDVALKLWRSQLDRRSTDMLLAEARSLARIRHPNVLVVHGADEHEQRAGMWTDLLKGHTLERLLTLQGPFSAGEAALIGVDLCRALAAVHSTGFVHGDVKPANVMREQGGRIVLMDFGAAAQARTTAGEATDPFPTGTPLIMAPEQLSGAPPRSGADLYALGVLLYRLVTARYPIEATSIAELRALHERRAAVPIRDRRPDLPPGFVAVVEQALSWDPERRFPSAGAMEQALTQSLRGLEEAAPRQVQAPGAAPRAPSRWGRLAVAGAILVAVAVGGFTLARRWPTTTTAESGSPLHYSIQLPAGLRLSGYANVAISPDGGSIVYAAGDSSGTSRLWLRRLDATDAAPLPGTEGAFYPFWAPNSREVAFFSRGWLKRVAVAGGPVREICKATAGRGGSWGRDGAILFAPSTEGPLSLVRAEGGSPVAVTTVDTTSGEVAHRWPCILPDGTHFVYVSLPAKNGEFRLFAGSLRSDRRKYIGPAESGATFASGCLIYVANRTLVARPFDDRGMSFKADAVPLADASRYEGSLAEAHASASQNGVLVYQALTNRENRLAWVQPGNPRLVTLATGPFFDPRVSPDGKRVAVERAESGTESNLWLLDAATGSAERLTDDPGLNRFPHWSPGGDTILFASNRSGRYEILERAVSGAAGERSLRLPPSVLLKWPSDWGLDGARVYTVYDPRTAYDVWIDGVSAITQPSNDASAVLSPDGAWLAFDSDQSGRHEVYCQDRTRGTTYRVSSSGGSLPRWCRGTGDLFYLTPRGDLMVRHPATSDPTKWPATRVVSLKGILSYDVEPMGRRLILCAEALNTHPDELSVLVNLPVAVARGL